MKSEEGRVRNHSDDNRMDNFFALLPQDVLAIIIADDVRVMRHLWPLVGAELRRQYASWPQFQLVDPLLDVIYGEDLTLMLFGKLHGSPAVQNKKEVRHMWQGRPHRGDDLPAVSVKNAAYRFRLEYRGKILVPFTQASRLKEWWQYGVRGRDGDSAHATYVSQDVVEIWYGPMIDNHQRIVSIRGGRKKYNFGCPRCKYKHNYCAICENCYESWEYSSIERPTPKWRGRAIAD